MTDAAGVGCGGFNAIDDFQVRSRGGFENIGADACAAIGTALYMMAIIIVWAYMTTIMYALCRKT